MKKLMFVVLAVFGLVSVGFGYELSEVEKGELESVKEIVAELEDLEKNGKLPYEGKSPLREGKLFLEFVEKLKQSSEKDCYRARVDVMRDLDNEYRYRYHTWSNTNGRNFRCFDLGVFIDDMKETRIELKKMGIELKSFGSK